MSEFPLISVCIPAYKRIDYLKRLVDSVLIQTYKDFEIVITDDSPDESVKEFLNQYQEVKNINYYRNEIVLGTPENWNESIRKANGTWIKLMHDDDWFANEKSLQIFYEATLNTNAQFIFSAYNNVTLNSEITHPVYLTFTGHFLLKQNSLNLFKKQFVGNPSCTLIKKDIDLFYDKDFKWVVDFEYYIRCLKKNKSFIYTNDILINVGLNDEQVTKYSFLIPEVEIPENHLMIEKLGFNILKNIFVYDYYWRLYRNLRIRNLEDVSKYYHKSICPRLIQMISFQSKVSLKILGIGIFSKTLMFLNYLYSGIFYRG